MAESFNFIDLTNEDRLEAIKWTRGTSRYEVYVSILHSLELGEVLPHSMSVRDKVLTTVNTDAQKGPSLYKVFPRTMTPVLRVTWDQVNQEADNNPDVDNTMTIENFDARLREFIAAHATAEDRYNLVQHLRACGKPRELPVQSFWYKLREFNSYVAWIPGTEPALNEQQMRQAFYDAMPPTWRKWFANLGNSVGSTSMVVVVCYFRQQEREATRKMQDNNQAQRRQSISCRCNNKGSPKGNQTN